ncbi:50S ribosomal protein L9 [Chlorella vulgaris]
MQATFAGTSLASCKSSVQAFKAGPSSTAAARTAVHVVAQKRVAKKQQVRLEPPAWSLLAQAVAALSSAVRRHSNVHATRAQVILVRNVPGLGSEGSLKSVPVGYFRNYLRPQGLAAFADANILEKIKRQREEEDRVRMEIKAKAQAMATALATIGKFVIKKKVGEKEAIFGSVTSADLVDAIKMQTGRELDKKTIAVPEIKSLGTYEASVKLHPEVTGFFKVVVQKDTSS